MTMFGEVGKVLTDENHTCSFDFSSADSCMQYHNELGRRSSGQLSDVDFVVIKGQKAYFIEYKSRFTRERKGCRVCLNDCVSRKHCTRVHYSRNLAKKYMDSLSVFWADGCEDPPRKLYKHYILLYGEEKPKDALRYIRNDISGQLPHRGKIEGLSRTIIDCISVITVDEFNEVFENEQFTAERC